MKRYPIKMTFITVLALLLLAGCGKKEFEPVAINEETDKCEICNMAVKDNQFSTEIILENGKSMVFDDIGCMYKWINENKDKKVAISYVKDYNTKDWIESEKASYVYDKPTKTPMAYNVITFTEQKDAQSFIDENGGKLMSYNDIQSHSWEKNEEMVKEMKEKMKQMNMDNKEDKEMEMENSEHSN